MLIESIDDDGKRGPPVTLHMEGGKTTNFNTNDLESGNPAKGIIGSTGAADGIRRLELSSPLDLQVFSYIRTIDGFLTAMHDIAPQGPDGLRIVTFNPAHNFNQRSSLRLINPGSTPANVSIEGIDDEGSMPGTGVGLTLQPGAAQTLTALELEEGAAHLSGSIGTGFGKWRLSVAADQPIQAMSLLTSPTGHLTNLSTAPDLTWRDETSGSYYHLVPLFPPPSEESRQGFVRVVNHSTTSGNVTIRAIEDDGRQRGPATLEIAGGQTRHFNSADLEAGNERKALTGALGAGDGAWRLKLESSLDIEVFSYIRTNDGFITAMHDIAPQTTRSLREVVTFNPANNYNQRSVLRVINPGPDPINVHIEGIDDEGQVPDAYVEVTIPAEGARMLTAKELEEGDADLSGSLGDGAGKWRLRIRRGSAVYLSLLESPTGHLTNLSTAPDSVLQIDARAGNTRISGRHQIGGYWGNNGSVSSVKSADLDGDGDMDVLAAIPSLGSSARQLAWYENLGGGAFSAEQTIGSEVPGSFRISVADIDADGDPDLLYTAGSYYGYSVSIAWRENLGGGSFSDERIIAEESTRFLSEVMVADVDLDGDDDALAHTEEGLILWYENVGNSISTRHVVAELDGVQHMQVADLDNDGDPDIVYSPETAANTVWLENAGDGAFTERQIVVDDEPLLGSLFVVDIDADGDGDIVRSGYGETDWIENLGAGRFSARGPVSSTEGGGLLVLDAADFDADGNLDLFGVGEDDRGEEALVWFENRGGGVFSPQRVITTGPYVVRQVSRTDLADMDGDGDIDVLVAGGATIDWHENLPDAIGLIRAKVIPEVSRLRVTWSVAPTLENDARYRYKVTATALEDIYERTCSAAISGGCSVKGVDPQYDYTVRVAVEGDAFGPATLTARSLHDPEPRTDFSESNPSGVGNLRVVENSFQVVDLDGDGDSDLLNLLDDFDYRGIAWWESLGTGAFSEYRVIADGWYSAVHAADLDGDGDVDLLSASHRHPDSEQRELVWYRSTGGGAFSNPLPIDANFERLESVRTADLDGDGDLDVIAVGQSGEPDPKVRWYENQGLGSFGAAQRVASTRRYNSDLYPADLDADGDVDLINSMYLNPQYGGDESCECDLIEWFENTGNGEFGESRYIAVDASYSTDGIRPMDVDGDGRVDLVELHSHQNGISWRRNIGGSRFSGSRHITEYYDGNPDLSDLDLDGDLDLVYLSAGVGSPFDKAIGWQENLGEHGFSAQRLIDDNYDGWWPYLFATDLDSDGVVDLLAIDSNDGEMVWYRNLGTTRAPTEAPTNVRVIAGVGVLWVIWDPVPDLGDHERNEARYLVSAVAPDGSIAGTCESSELLGCTITGLDPGQEYQVTVQAENDAGTGPFSKRVSGLTAVDDGYSSLRFATRRVVANEYLWPLSIHAADLDDDTDVDVLSATFDDDSIAWYENQAQGSRFVGRALSSTADGASKVVTGDLDNDGDEDVVSYSRIDRKVAWYENLSGGSFAAENVIALDVGRGSLHLADLDQDGDLDLLLGDSGEFGLGWYENQGNAIFVGPRSLTDPVYRFGGFASPSDLDLDGDLDVLYTISDRALGWHENLGGGSFSPARTIATGEPWRSFTSTLSAADLDGDGDPDILHGSGVDDSLGWFENRGEGLFFGRRVFATEIADSFGAESAVDLDGDGDLDLLVAISSDSDSSAVIWYENLDRGQFSAARIVTTQVEEVRDAIAVDVDGDGNTDVVAASAGDNVIAWFRNLGSAR